ncbi:MAG: lamin tail domain-containing protein [Candidatus Nealsonbacteria bacterium]|nr:lamin tail domain-containing protein [Candidatus Nealsonbacteria bacterium]
MTNWRIRGDIDFDFSSPEYHGPAPVPEDFLGRITLGAGQVIVIVGFDPDHPANAQRLVDFQTYYGIDESVKLAGPFVGELDATGGEVRLMSVDLPRPAEKHYWPPVLEDQVIYDDETPWPVQAAGSGDSLNRAGLHLWGNNPTSWNAALPTPGMGDVGAGNLVITELNYNPYDPTPDELLIDLNFQESDFEFIEVLNSGNEPIVLTGMRLAGAVTHLFSPGTLAPGERAVVVNDPKAFQTRYGTGIRVLGGYTGNLNNSSERLGLLDSSGRVLLDFTYFDGGDWPGRRPWRIARSDRRRWRLQQQ